MATTQRNDTKRAVFFADLMREWDKRPELSFGELMAGSLDSFVLARIGQLADAQIVEAVRRFTSGPETVPPETERGR